MISAGIQVKEGLKSASMKPGGRYVTHRLALLMLESLVTSSLVSNQKVKYALSIDCVMKWW
ncbi:MAG: hypothetical protein A6F71_05870 [Cycloclasticus sp. symbiont of Poecilosclerida sp. M]|nr:MAG: hypothetical protein A6F71_05870 [Cycloclasticus sp. symbiont of Poecilosclerida sp. M]